MADSISVPAAATTDERVFPPELVQGDNDFASITETVSEVAPCSVSAGRTKGSPLSRARRSSTRSNRLTL